MPEADANGLASVWRRYADLLSMRAPPLLLAVLPLAGSATTLAVDLRFMSTEQDAPLTFSGSRAPKGHGADFVGVVAEQFGRLLGVALFRRAGAQAEFLRTKADFHGSVPASLKRRVGVTEGGVPAREG